MKSKPQPNKRILLTAAVGVVALALVLILIAVNNGKQSDAQEVIAITTPEPVVKPEAEVRSHFEALGQVKQSLSGKKAKLQAGKDALTDLKNRGFDQFEVTTSYDAEGHWSAEIEISTDENTKHPLYETIFAPDEETLWVIYDYNGAIMAKPLLHPSLPDEDVPVYLSETGTLMCYDAYNNMFYELIPSPETAKVFQVPKVDSNTLIHWVYTEDNVQ